MHHDLIIQRSISAEKVVAVVLDFDIPDFVGHPVGDDDIGLLLEYCEVVG